MYSQKACAPYRGSSRFSLLVDRAKQIPILEIAEPNLAKIKRVGRCHMACCPFHADKTPSLAFYEDTNSFYCFSCGKGGDVIRFVETLYNCGFKDAITRLTGNSYGV